MKQNFEVSAEQTEQEKQNQSDEQCVEESRLIGIEEAAILLRNNPETIVDFVAEGHLHAKQREASDENLLFELNEILEYIKVEQPKESERKNRASNYGKDYSGVKYAARLDYGHMLYVSDDILEEFDWTLYRARWIFNRELEEIANTKKSGSFLLEQIKEEQIPLINKDLKILDTVRKSMDGILFDRDGYE